MTTRKKWVLSVLTSGGCLGLGFIILLLNPSLLYAHETITGEFTIYHSQPLDPAFRQRLAQARALVQPSEVFDSTLRLQLCLNDGSQYPRLAQVVWGPAFAWGFYNKVILNGQVNAAANQLTFRQYAWNLTRLLAHEMTHCYQFQHFGLWHSNPLARYPTWKWEGYAEYVARRPGSPAALRQHVAYLQQAEQRAPGQWGLRLPDSTSTSREYFKYLILTEYCLAVKHLTFQQTLRDTTSERTTYQQLLNWCQSEKATGKRE
ncbi:MAG: hypothetical protein ACRYFZ_04265 [Janthinobacterium lividum]